MDNKLSTIKGRVVYLIEYHGDVKERFFEKIGMTYGNFKGPAKKTPLNSNAIVNILSIYNDVNPEWLLTGNGEMLRHNDSPKPTIDTKRLDELNEMIEMQRKLIKNLEAEVKRLEKELEKTQSFPSSHMAADDELSYAKKKR